MLALVRVSPNAILWDEVNIHPKVSLQICAVQFNVKLCCLHLYFLLWAHVNSTLGLRLSYEKLSRKMWWCVKITNICNWIVFPPPHFYLLIPEKFPGKSILSGFIFNLGTHCENQTSHSDPLSVWQISPLPYVNFSGDNALMVIWNVVFPHDSMGLFCSFS